MKQLTRPRTLAAALLTVSALTACGTTVNGAGSLANGAGVGGDGLGGTLGAVTDTTSGVTPEGPRSDPGGTISGSTGGGSASTGRSTSQGASGSTSVQGTSGSVAAGTSGAAGTVKSKKPLTVLFFYVNGGNKALSTVFPGSSASFGDGKGEANAIIADINGHGGVNGQLITPSFVPIEAAKADDASVGSACQGAVQDSHPIAILSIFNISRPLVECAKKNNVLLLDVALGAGDDGVYRSAPNLAFSPTQISRDLESRLVLTLAHASGTLTAKTPVGILTESDDPQFGNVTSATTIPLLKSWGVPYTEATITNGADSSGLSAAVLKFRSAGDTHVVFSLGGGGIPEVLFMTNADQQSYAPRYLMGDSTDTSFVESAAPTAQVKNITGAGTYPLANVAAGDYPSSAGEKHCLAVLDKAVGGYKNRGTSLTGTLACELLYGFSFIAKRVPGNVTATSFVAAYRSVGRAYPALTTFASDLTGARNDNATLFRSFAYQAACQCIKYTSDAKAITAVTG